MEDLIKALLIFNKYTSDKYPTWCSHDVFHVCVDPDVVEEEDKDKLKKNKFYS